MDLTALKRRVVMDPADLGARVDLGRALLEAGQRAEAERQWEGVLERDATHEAALRIFADHLVTEERYPVVERIHRAALEKRPDHVPFRMALARALWAQGRRDDARLTLSHPSSADSGDAMTLLARWDADEGAWAPAFERARRAVALRPEDPEVRALWLAAALRSGAVDDVVKHARALPAVAVRWGRTHQLLRGAATAALAPTTAEALWNAWRARDVHAAKRAVMALPAGGLSQWLRAELRALEGDTPRALEALAALNMDSLPPDVCVHVGTVRGELGDVAGALDAVESAVLAEPRAHDAQLELLGDLRWLAGRREEARQAWTRGANREPHGACALRLACLAQAGAAQHRSGRILALAWNRAGGCVSPVEAVAVPAARGEGAIHLTGNVHGSGLEAAQVVHAALKAGARALGLGNTVSEHDLHIHYVDTELHKDGPSAGLALALACVSALRGRALPPMLAASGELTLHGGVRSVAGLHEKLTAARLHGVTRVLLPAATLFDVRALSPDVTRGLTLAFVDSIQQAVATVWPAGEATP